MKIQYLLSFIFVLISLSITGQENPEEIVKNSSEFSIELNGGYDFPSFTDQYTFYDMASGPKFGISLSYNFPKFFGVGLDYDFLRNKPTTNLPAGLIDATQTTSYPLTKETFGLNRHFVGIGPQFQLKTKSNRLRLLLYSRAGLGILNGGEIAVYSQNAANPSTKDYHLLFSGFDSASFSYKLGAKVDIGVTSNIFLTLGAYHMRYAGGVTPDANFDVDGIGQTGFVYGASPITESGSSFILQNTSAKLVRNASCSTCSSSGIELGLTYIFGSRNSKKKEPEISSQGSHKVVVTVIDYASKKVIPEADVAVRDRNGDIIATGTTNSFGVVDLGEVAKGNHKVEGQVYGIATTVTEIFEEEFIANSVVKSEIYYTDMRFILKGVVVDKSTRIGESDVVVNLTNQGTREVSQQNSNGKGQFAFQLDANTSYELVGVKEERLSDIERASTVGLTRSTTLFVDLELGVDPFDCGSGTLLDIKYDLAKAELRPEARFELERLVRYLQDHPQSMIELSSHTDSRGEGMYNLDLSNRRASSAVNYIVSRGVSSSRIIAKGYGEMRLLNNCADGVNCSEADHQINRRTEAKLICRN